MIRRILPVMTDQNPAPESSEEDSEATIETPEWTHSTLPPQMLDADRWAECVDPDDGDYLAGTAMERN